MVNFYNEVISLKKTISEKNAKIYVLQQKDATSQKKLVKLKKIAIANSDLRIKLNSIEESNNELIKTVDILVRDNNSLRETVKLAVKAGVSKPKKVGSTPNFTANSRGSSVVFRKNLKSLSRGSYQHKITNISFNINNKSKWTKAGNWMVTMYTATTEECDLSPSITADSKLVTPGFTVAIDPRYWKYGTIFYFEGLGFGVAADCGGGIKGKNRADFLVSSRKLSLVLSGHRQVWVVYIPK